MVEFVFFHENIDLDCFRVSPQFLASAEDDVRVKMA